MQNNRHIEELRKFTPFKDIPIYSVIVFYGSCVLKDVSAVPEGTFLVYPSEVLSLINSIINNNTPAKYIDKVGMIRILKHSVLNGDDEEIRNKHIASIREN